MQLIDVISWAGVVIVLSVYSTGNMKWFNRANIVWFIPICLPALVRGAYSAAFISIAFGLIALYREFR